MTEVNTLLNKHPNTPIMLDFYADWCTSCLFIERALLNDKAILQSLKQLLWIKIDITDMNEDADNLLAHYQVVAPPTFIFLKHRGDDKLSNRIEGEAPKNEWEASLKKLLN